MAAETIEGLYLRIGLDYNELNQDFVAVEETLYSNMQRLNNQNTLIELQAKIDLAGVTDAEEKLRIQQEKLTKQIEIQKQKLNLLEASWKAEIQVNGEASKQAQNAEKAFKKQELIVAQLNQKLKELTDTQAQVNSGKGNNLLSRYEGMKGKISQLAGSFSNLKEAATSADSAITKTLEIISGIPSPTGKVVAALAAIPLAVRGIQNSILEMATPSIEAGDSFYVMSRGLQMSIAEMAKLSTICKVTGIEISEVIAVMKRLNMQIERGGEDGNAATRALKRFGVEARNATGELKNAYDMSLALAEGLSKAQETGRGKEFIASVLGRQATGDIVTYLEDLAGNIELSKKIVKNGLFNPVLAHNVQGEINAMNTQAAQLGSAFSSALLPVANIIVPQLREQMGSLTKVISDNADGIKALASVFADFAVLAGDAVTSVTKKMFELAGSVGDVIRQVNRNNDAQLQAYIDKYKDFKDLTAEGLMESELGDALNFFTPAQKKQALEYWQAVLKEIKKARAEAEKLAAASLPDFKKLSDNILSDEELERLKADLAKIDDELLKLKIELEFDEDSYGKSLSLLKAEYQKALDAAKDFEIKQEKLKELYGAKFEQLERQHQKEIHKLNQETSNIVYNVNHSALEKQLRDIENWRRQSIAAIKDRSRALQNAATINKNALAKEAEAFKNEFDRMRGNIQSLAEKIFEQEHSQRDIDIYRAQKIRAESLKQGYPADMVEHWYENELANIWERSRNNEDYNHAPKLAPKDDDIIVYGDIDDNFFHKKNKVPILYGDTSDFEFPDTNFYDEMQAEIKQVADQQKILGVSAEDVAKTLAQIETDTVNEKLGNFGTAVEDTTSILKQAAEQLSDIQPQIYTPNSGGNNNTALQFYNANKDFSTALNSAVVPNDFSLQFQQISQDLLTLTQTAGTIAQEAQKFNQQQKQPPVINVSPNIQIDLGGAYVFDNAMKASLTDDIASEVANAVKEAVENAKSRSDLGY